MLMSVPVLFRLFTACHASTTSCINRSAVRPSSAVSGGSESSLPQQSAQRLKWPVLRRSALDWMGIRHGSAASTPAGRAVKYHLATPTRRDVRLLNRSSTRTTRPLSLSRLFSSANGSAAVPVNACASCTSGILFLLVSELLDLPLSRSPLRG